MSDAKATIESALLTAMAETSNETRLTVDKCHGLVEATIRELFRPSTRWAVEEYLRETQDGD